MGRAALAAVALAAAFAYGGDAAPGDPELALVGTFSSPTYLTAPPGDAERLFVVEQGGQIRVVRNGATLTTAFLDLTSLVLSGGERGLLSMAFAPDYASSGPFYVYYTARSPTGQVVIAEYRRSPNPDVADSTTARPVLTIPHPLSNHNGGQLQFGPDGYLYIGTGDGGGAGDPDGNGQNLETLLGKILRINPAGAPYTIPADNPFVGQAGRDEIWSYGLRNPWRFSFDRQTGDLVVGDVGQGNWEEIDFVPVGAGRGRGANSAGTVGKGEHSSRTARRRVTFRRSGSTRTRAAARSPAATSCATRRSHRSTGATSTATSARPRCGRSLWELPTLGTTGRSG
jgi:hypothetical protein